MDFINPGALLLGMFALLIFLRVPIAVALGISGITVIIVADLGAQMFAPVFFANISKFSLLAIPFFILAGILMGRAQISERIIRLVSLIAGPFRGGLAIVTVVTACFWGAVSGSGPATVAALGTILIPGMIKAGYDKGFAAAIMSASSGIAIIIPPSIAFIVYGVITGASISKLFAAGFLPGILVGAALIVPAYIISVKRGYGGEKAGTLKEIIVATKDAAWGLIAPVIILGGIYGGIFTPTEAAAVGVFYGLFVGVFVYKTLKFQDIVDLLVETGVASAVVMLVVAFAGIFGWAMTTLGVVEKISQLALAVTDNPVVLLLIINFLLLIAGMLLDAISIMYLLLPLLMPIMAHYGWDLVWFGVMMTVNLAIGQITPPVAVNLYVGANIAKISMDAISRAVWPFVFASIVALLLITFVPEISLIVPKLLLK
jgi:C4-dicarboxylate transporter DctM subunit